MGILGISFLITLTVFEVACMLLYVAGGVCHMIKDVAEKLIEKNREAIVKASVEVNEENWKRVSDSLKN